MTCSIRSSCMLLLLSVSVARPLSGQGSPLVAGERIRIHQTNPCCAATIRGILLSATPDSVRYSPLGIAEVITLPRASIFGVERVIAAGDRKPEGAAFGFILGAILGGVLASQHTYPDVDHGSFKGFGTLAGGVGGALVGTVLGVVVGSHLGWERWEPAVLPVNVGLTRDDRHGVSRYHDVSSIQRRRHLTREGEPRGEK